MNARMVLLNPNFKPPPVPVENELENSAASNLNKEECSQEEMQQKQESQLEKDQ